MESGVVKGKNQMDLFVSDLDGTLLNNSQEISGYSLAVIHSLLKQGMLFSIATARSMDSAAPFLRKLRLQLPIIVHNGVFVLDPQTGAHIREALLDWRMAEEILTLFASQGISPFMFVMDSEERERILFQDSCTPGEKDYCEHRTQKGDQRFCLIDDFSRWLSCKIITIIAISDRQHLCPVYERVRKKYDLHINFAEDIYSKAYWLEIANPRANKREAVRYLKNHVGAERLICFGDHLNDCPMFEIADETYAVSNAQQCLKNMATRVIGSNEENAVADCLWQLWRRNVTERDF